VPQPKAANHDGRIYVNQRDVTVVMLTAGQTVTFFVLDEGRSFGAEEVIVF